MTIGQNTTRKTEIRDVVFTYSPMGALDAWDVLVSLTRILGKPLEEAFTVDPTGAMNFSVPKIVGMIARHINDHDAQVVRDKYLGRITYRPAGYPEAAKPLALSADFDNVFRGRMIDFVKLLSFCLSEDFADFLGPLRATDQGSQNESPAQAVNPST